jgi:hypothetical protein
MLQVNLERKLEQAQFHLAQLKSADDELAQESCLGGFLGTLKSVYWYLQKWMLDNKKVTDRSEFWEKKVSPWVKVSFPAGEFEKWDCIMRLRDVDTHDEPIRPFERVSSSWWNENWWNKDWWNEHWWASVKDLTVSHPKTGKVHNLYDACDAAIAITSKLIQDYQNL